MLTSHKLPENPTFISDFIVIIAFGIVQILAASGLSALLAAILYLSRINHILKQTPNEIKQLTSKPWNPALLSEIYERLDHYPLDLYKGLPPKLDRRYIVTGGNDRPYAI